MKGKGQPHQIVEEAADAGDEEAAGSEVVAVSSGANGVVLV